MQPVTFASNPPCPDSDMATKYNIKYFYDITDRSNFRANPDYKGVCHIALAQVGTDSVGPRPMSVRIHCYMDIFRCLSG